MSPTDEQSQGNEPEPSRKGEPSGVPARARRTRRERFEALSDGVFGFAITLLVLDVAVPASSHSAHHLLDALADTWPAYLGYLVSFATIGAIWLGHNALTDYLEEADLVLLRLNLLLLLFVAFLPFPTRLLADYVTAQQAERIASTFYGLTLLASVAILSLLWRYAWRARLIRADVQDVELSMLTNRLTPGLIAYGALIVLGLFVPTLAVFGYLVVALYFIFPVHRLRGLLRRS